MLATAGTAIVPSAAFAAITQRAGNIACSVCVHNLILNPGAEAGPGTNDDSIVKVPDWKQTGGFTAAQYAWSGGDISATTPGPKNRGKNYFYGGPGFARSTGTQVTPLGRLPHGVVDYAVSAWLGGYSDQGDNAALYVTFENASGATTGSVSLGPVTAGRRDSNSELLYRHQIGRVPAGTVSVKVALVMVRTDGSDNDGMADNLSFSLASLATAPK
jgi:hypothetical protein